MMSPDTYRQFRMDAPIHVQVRRSGLVPPGGNYLHIVGRVWRIFRDDNHTLHWGQRVRFGVDMINPERREAPAPGGTIYHPWEPLGRARWVEAFLSEWNGEFHLVSSQIAAIRGPRLKPICDPAAEGFCCRGNL